jgi:hypothetical protein
MYKPGGWRKRGEAVFLRVPIMYLDMDKPAGVGKAWNKSMDAFHWTSMLVHGATIDFQLYIFSLFGLCRRQEPTHNTYDAVFAVLRWSFYWLYMGKWPTHTWDGYRIASANAGKDLADGFFCVIWNLKGDLDYFAKCLGLRHYASKQPCFLCPADTSDNAASGFPWKDFRAGVARCIEHTYTKASWKRLFPVHNAMLTLPGLSILTCTADHMHCKHMGTDMWFFGSVLWLLVFQFMTGECVFESLHSERLSREV